MAPGRGRRTQLRGRASEESDTDVREHHDCSDTREFGKPEEAPLAVRLECGLLFLDLLRVAGRYKFVGGG